MPIRNEAAFIERSLGAVLRQDYPHDRYEVVVIDGMSTDGTRERVDRLAAGSDVAVRVIDNPAKIVPPAMNLGIRAAKGDIIVRMDGHTIAAPDYVSCCVSILAESGADNVGGCMTCVADTPTGRAIGVVTSHPFGIGNAKFHYATTAQAVDTVYLGCWRREAFDRFGMFDEFFLRTQDSEFNYRTRMLGGTIRLDPRITSEYYNRSSLLKLWKQYFQYGFWKTRLMFKLRQARTHGSSASTSAGPQKLGRLALRHFAPPLFALTMVVSLLLILAGLGLRVSNAVPGWAGLLLLACGLVAPGIYAVLVFLVSIRLARKHDLWTAFPILLATFPVLHLSWGLGFLKGLLQRPAAEQFAAIPAAATAAAIPTETATTLAEYPFVSVIMPIRNEENFIAASLQAMLQQDYPANCYEILAVDGQSTDRTREIIQELAAKSPVAVRLLENHDIYVSSAMNIGIREATGSIILRMDGHVLAAPDYVRRSVETLIRTGADNVGGVVEFTGRTPLAQAIGLACRSFFGSGGAPARSNRQGHVDTVSFGCWPKETFSRYGMFDEHFIRTQDSELNYRIRLLGGRIWMNPQITSSYHTRSGLLRLARQHFQYGFWKTRLVYKLGWHLAPRHFGPPLLVVGLLFSVVALIFWLLHQFTGWPTVPWPPKAWLLLGLPIPLSYVLACLAAGIYKALKLNGEELSSFAHYETAHALGKVRLAFLLTLIFPVLHLTWGLGFIIGMLRRPGENVFAELPTIEAKQP